MNTKATQSLARGDDTAREMPSPSSWVVGFLRYFVPLLVLLLAGAFLYAKAKADRELVRLKAQEALSVGLSAGTLTRIVDTIKDDVCICRLSANLAAGSPNLSETSPA